MFQSMWSFEFRFRTEPCREVKTFNTKCIWTFLFTQSKLQLVINSIHWVILLTNNQQTVEIPTRSLIALGMLNQPYWLAQSQYTVRVHSTERWKSAVRGGIPQTTPHLQGPNRHRRACQCLHSLMSDSARYSWGTVHSQVSHTEFNANYITLSSSFFGWSSLALGYQRNKSKSRRKSTNSEEFCQDDTACKKCT